MFYRVILHGKRFSNLLIVGNRGTIQTRLAQELLVRAELKKRNNFKRAWPIIKSVSCSKNMATKSSTPAQRGQEDLPVNGQQSL